MKKLLILLTMLCFMLTGCSGKQSEEIVPPEEISIEATEEEMTQEEAASPKEEEVQLTPEELLEEYLDNPVLLDTPVREYGEETGYIQLEEDLVARILYPEGEITELNNEITKWVEEIVAEYKIESEGSSAEGDAAELTAEYDSYLVDEDIVSVKITGVYEKPYLAHPIDIIKTFHASVKTGKLVTLDELLTESGRELLQNMVIEDSNANQEWIDEYLLDNWTLTKEGLEIILERGDYLSMSEGTVTLQYSYDQLGEILASLKEEAGEPATEEVAEETTEEAAEPSVEPAPVVMPEGQADPAKPMIALTFDDGPSKHTSRLLDIFATHGGKGTFFVVGNVLDGRAETLQRMAGDGHEIAGHSWNHRQLTKLSAEELTDQIMTTRAKIYEITGVDTTLIRPPYGSYNNDTKSVCANLGIIMVNWSVDTLDWKYKDSNRIYNTIMNEVKDGSIILCHDLHATTVDAMERVIPDLIAQGYQLVTVSELLANSSKEIVAGGVYNNK